MQEVLTTKKPWVLLIFVLVAINAIVALGAATGMKTAPLDQGSTQGTIFSLPEAEPTTPTSTVNPYATQTFSMAAFLLLVLDVLILYGMYKGMVWTWWLLTFTTLSTLVTAIFGYTNGETIAVLPFVVNLVMVAALLKKEVVSEFRPQLHIIPKDGLW